MLTLCSVRYRSVVFFAATLLPCGGRAQTEYVPPSPRQLEKCLETLKCSYVGYLRDATYNAIRHGQTRRVIGAYRQANEDQREEIIIGIQWSDENPSEHQFDSLVRSFLQTSRAEDLYEDGRWNALQYLAARCDKKALRTLMLGGATKDSESLMRFPISSTEWAASLASFGKCDYTPARDVLTYSLDAASLNAADAAYQSLQELYPGICKKAQSPESAEKCYLNHWSELDKHPLAAKTKKNR